MKVSKTISDLLGVCWCGRLGMVLRMILFRRFIFLFGLIQLWFEVRHL